LPQAARAAAAITVARMREFFITISSSRFSKQYLHRHYGQLVAAIDRFGRSRQTVNSTRTHYREILSMLTNTDSISTFPHKSVPVNPPGQA
jgi:hypothetical protein